MWRTSSNERTLAGAEAMLFAESLLDLLEETNLSDDCDDDYLLGVSPFDNLTYGQKISVLSTVGNCLLREDVPAVELTAVLEGTIAAIFQHLKICIEIEFDESEFSPSWRSLVVSVREEMEGEQMPESSCEDMEEWDLEVDIISDCILWDADYESDKIYLDGEPERTKFLRHMARIPDNYFMAIADELREDEIEEKVDELRELCCKVIKGK